MASEKLSIQTACRVLGVAESGFYEWRTRPLSPRALRHAWLTEQIQAVHQASFGTYGSRAHRAPGARGAGERDDPHLWVGDHGLPDIRPTRQQRELGRHARRARAGLGL